MHFLVFWIIVKACIIMHNVFNYFPKYKHRIIYVNQSDLCDFFPYSTSCRFLQACWRSFIFSDVAWLDLFLGLCWHVQIVLDWHLLNCTDLLDLLEGRANILVILMVQPHKNVMPIYYFSGKMAFNCFLNRNRHFDIAYYSRKTDVINNFGNGCTFLSCNSFRALPLCGSH